MLLKRTCFFATVLALSILGLGVGFEGGSVLADRVLGAATLNARPYFMTDWHIWAGMFFWSLGAVIGFVGIYVLVILPLTFYCPNARRAFRWQRKDAPWEIALLTWYGKELQKYANGLPVPNNRIERTREP